MTMHNRYLKVLQLFFVGLFLWFTLSSCEQNGLSGSSSSVQSNDFEKKLTRGNGSDPESLDPQLARSESALTIIRDLYEGLLTRNAKGELVPGVAQRWIFNPAKQCTTFFLRPDAKWSNGDQVTANDFVRGFKYAVNIKNNSPYANLLEPIKNVKQILSGKRSLEDIGVVANKTDELIICMQDKSPAYALELFALPVTYPRHYRHSKLSNGAYALDKKIAGSKVIVKKNQFYHSEKDVYFAQVDFVTTEDIHSELKRFLTQELDITASVPPQNVKRLEQSNKRQLKIAPVLNTYFYGFNTQKPPFDNKHVREALSLTIDRDILVDKILGTGEQAAWSIVPPLMANYAGLMNKDALLTPTERVARAKILYKKAGYSDATPLVFELRYNTSPLHKKIAVALAAMWQENLGAKAELYNEEWKVFVQSRRNGDTELFRSGWIADINDASNYLELFTREHPLNDYGYANDRFDELLATSSVAESDREQTLLAAEEQLLKDYVILPLYFYVSKHLVQQDIQGWSDNILDIHLSKDLSRH